jgi:hypothetical protein
VTPHLSLLVETRKEEHATVRASLFRARLAVASETERRVKLREASIKNLTGGDRIAARHLYEDFWEFAPSHSLWLQTNYLPEITGRDPGIWRRVRVVPWVAHFDRKTADPDLTRRLRAEGAGILRWGVEGTLAYLAQGLEEPEAVVLATSSYRHSEDLLGRFAADVGLAFGEDLEIRSSELRDLLKSWVESEGVESPGRDLSDWLVEHGARKDRPRIDGRRVVVWSGVGLAETDGGHTGHSDYQSFSTPTLMRDFGADRVHPVHTGAQQGVPAQPQPPLEAAEEALASPPGVCFVRQTAHPVGTPCAPPRKGQR